MRKNDLRPCAPSKKGHPKASTRALESKRCIIAEGPYGALAPSAAKLLLSLEKHRVFSIVMTSQLVRRLAVVGASLILGACAGLPSNSARQDLPGDAVRPEADADVRIDEAADAQLDAAALAYHDQVERVAQRLRAACVSPDYRAYYAKTACLPSGITPKMLEDRTRITKAQKTAAQAVFNITKELSDETRAIMIKTGLPEYMDLAESSRTKADPKIRAMQQGLLEGRLTWGEYNKARLALAQAWRDEDDESEDQPEDAPEDADAEDSSLRKEAP